MKMKVKFDKASLVGFFANNGEKIVFGIVVLIFFMFVWNAFTCESYDKKPEDLERVAADARQHIEKAPWEVDREIIDYRKKIEEISDPIAATPYRIPTTWEPPIFPPLRKRGQPVLFPVENLVATPGHGRFNDSLTGSMRTAPGGGLMAKNDPAGKRWVVVTGLVNMEKYIKSYQECFEDVALKQQTDYPNFLTYRVERAEITDENQDPTTLKWGKPYRGNMERYVTKYSNGGAGQNEQTNPAFINRAIIFPLPARVDRDWGEEVLHAPEIPMLDPMALRRMGTSPKGMHPMEDEDATAEGEEEEDDDELDEPTGFGRASGMGRGGMGRGGMPGMGMGDMPGMGMRGITGRGRVGIGSASMTQEKLSPYLLFRFFDFNVEPGKRYRYRVRLYLANPNFNVEERFLDSELATLAQNLKQWKPFIVSVWSDPSEVINMPLDDSLLIAEVSKSTRVDAEPTATVTAIHWDYEKGLEVFGEFPITRGMVVNLYGKEIPANLQVGGGLRGGPGGIGGLGMQPPGAPPRGGRRGARPVRQPKETVDYVTEMLVLDLKGGERLPGRTKKLTQPSSMLLFSPNGTMMVRSSVDDDEEREKLKNPKAGGMRRGGMPGGMMGPGMMGP